MVLASVRPDRSVVDRTRERRSRAWIARTELWKRSKLDRVRSCGHHSVREDGSVAVRVRGGDDGRTAGFAGLASCGSVWACPVCARKIAAGRQDEVGTMVTRWQGMDGALVFGTYTVSHRKEQGLAAVWDSTRDGWKAITSGKAWRQNRERFGIEHYLRITETKYGENGWHVHVHVLFFVNNPLTHVGLSTLHGYMLARWRAGIGKHGFTASARRGVDLRNVLGADDDVSRLAEYVVKQQFSGSAASTAAEMTRGDLKTGRGGSRTPFELLEDGIMAGGDAPEWGLWAEWERASKGRRQIGPSRGLREFFRITDRSDEDIAAESLGTALDDVVVLPRETVAVVRHMGWRVLNVAEVDGPAVLRLWLAGNGFEWSETPPPDTPASGRARQRGAVAAIAQVDAVRRRRGLRRRGLNVPAPVPAAPVVDAAGIRDLMPGGMLYR